VHYRLITVTAAVVGGLCLSLVVPQAQTTQARADTTNAASASKSTPRTADGHPDLSGQWYHRIGAPAPQIKPGQSFDAGHPATAEALRNRRIVQYPVGKAVYKPEFAAKVKDLDVNQIDTDPAWYCGPPGVPRIGPPQKIVQTSKEIVFLYDDLSGNFFRVVRMNGTHRTDIEPSAHGDSIGRWEGDTLVVDVTNLDDSTWLGDNGLIHSDKTHVIERLTRNGDTLTYDVITEDPMLAEPFVTKGRTLNLMTDYEIEEAPHCVERDRPHMQDLSHHGNVR
jgi:hypothetical protein